MTASAASCAVTALKPTYGRIETKGAILFAPTVDTFAVVARSAEDCGIVLGATDANEKHPFVQEPAVDWRELVVGYLDGASSVRGLDLGEGRPIRADGDGGGEPVAADHSSPSHRATLEVLELDITS